jgi:hypothetical protein
MMVSYFLCNNHHHYDQQHKRTLYQPKPFGVFYKSSK